MSIYPNQTHHDQWHSAYHRVAYSGFGRGTSHDTGAFTCDAIRDWWYQHGHHRYPAATSILLLCDGGGSNRSRQYLFKQALQRLVNELRIEMRIHGQLMVAAMDSLWLDAQRDSSAKSCLATNH